MWVVTHRSIQKLDLAAALSEFIDKQHLVDIVARQAVGGGDQHALEGRKGSAVAQAIQTGTIELGATKPIIAIDVLFGQMPVLLLCDMDTQTVELLVNRLGLLLATGR